MRKRTVTCIAKNIFWSLIYLLPWLVIFIGFIFSLKSDVVVQNLIDNEFSMYEFFPSYANYIMETFVGGDNLVTQSLLQIFGDGGIFPIFGAYDVFGNIFFNYFGYFVGVYLIHLAIDFLLFIPRLVHKWMNSFTGTEDCD